ncbi:uncharacterized protein LOC112349555 isoform X2 [Selaginella moellendorffii]|uniref:uncharacterized protein LOC112349555 isoform X2 n=1 Tax=Selaginella moellendorffii TaxID=88036 RepID=UPI000D1C2771|nr:uncharacterized protein LOC112349555 isoform X2 [Selaginella moellendorffii]|eukprot:XP_024539930.1 uncharacterized protein LOC112349555 isoform X2 [Selaginella moellendorffii]
MTTVAAAASFEILALTSLVRSNSNQDSSALTFHHFSNMLPASADRFPRKVISFLAPASLFFSLHCSYTLEGRRCASARLFFISLEPADKLLLVGSSTKARMTASFIHAYHYGGHVLRHRGPTIERKQAKRTRPFMQQSCRLYCRRLQPASVRQLLRIGLDSRQ